MYSVCKHLLAPFETIPEATVGGCVARGGDGDDIVDVLCMIRPFEVHSERVASERQRVFAGNSHFHFAALPGESSELGILF